jgi:Uma2 family endonuclease
MKRTRNSLPSGLENMDDLLKHLGKIHPRRIRFDPLPGTATEQDVITIQDREDRLYELVDGVLVEKIMGMPESCVAIELGRLMANHVRANDLGIMAGADGTVRLMPGLVRIPDLAFVSWDRLPTRAYPADPIPDLAPDLAVEGLSKGNTSGEMKRKLKEYFLCGVRLVWFVRLDKRTVQVFTAPDQSTRLEESQTLEGGDVLPGFKLPLEELFALVRIATPRKGNGKKSNGR